MSSEEDLVHGKRRRGPAVGALCSNTGWAAAVVTSLLAGRAAQAQAPQLPPPSQAESTLQHTVQQNPAVADMIRQRIQQSGLSPDQVRERLQASGYPPSLLDAYLGSGQNTLAQAPSAEDLTAIEALGLPPLSAQAESLPLDTGFSKLRGGQTPSSVFGVDVFRRTSTQFMPLLNGPVPADYKLGAGDVLVLIVTGELEFAYTLPVTREGFILIPQVGQVYVANLTLEELRDVLYARLGRVYSEINRSPGALTHFDISVANVRANQVYVVGEVAQPGAYQISALGTVLTALYAAGGVTERANLRTVEVRRLGKPVTAFDLYDYLLRGDTEHDIRLETGDVVFVGVHGTRVRVSGAVRRPAIYETKAGETLADVITAAAGFRPDAQLNRVAVFRLLPAADRGPGAPPRAVIDVPLHASAPSGPKQSGDSVVVDPASPVIVPGLALEDGDSVVVDTVRSLQGQYYVSITGMVEKPGMYPWHDGMTLRDLVLLARGPSVGAYLKEAEVARLPADRSHGQLSLTIRIPMDSTYLGFERDSAGHFFGPPGLPTPAGGAPEVPLEPYDNVLILRQPDFDLQRAVEIFGEVNYPGVYALKTKTDRLTDLVGRAGGLTPRAYPEGIQFIRAAGHAGRINVDLARALKNASDASNVVLQPNDSIFVPEYVPTVLVDGAVNAAGSVLYKKGASLDYYIDGAGGFSYLADKGRVSVRSANGTVRTRHKTFLFANDPEPQPGSEVLVPVKDTTNRINYTAIVGALAQVFASMLAIYAIAEHL